MPIVQKTFYVCPGCGLETELAKLDKEIQERLAAEKPAKEEKHAPKAREAPKIAFTASRPPLRKNQSWKGRPKQPTKKPAGEKLNKEGELLSKLKKVQGFTVRDAAAAMNDDTKPGNARTCVMVARLWELGKLQELGFDRQKIGKKYVYEKKKKEKPAADEPDENGSKKYGPREGETETEYAQRLIEKGEKRLKEKDD